MLSFKCLKYLSFVQHGPKCAGVTAESKRGVSPFPLLGTRIPRSHGDFGHNDRSLHQVFDSCLDVPCWTLLLELAFVVLQLEACSDGHPKTEHAPIAYVLAGLLNEPGDFLI